MSASRVTASSIAQGLPKSRSLLAGNYAYGGGATWLIERINVGSAGAATVTFSSIPQTFTHLQMRWIASPDTANSQDLLMRFNGDTAADYTTHVMYGQGSTAVRYNEISQTSLRVATAAGSTNLSGAFCAGVMDIADYVSTSKNKTFRALIGFDTNASTANIAYGGIQFQSGFWFKTPEAISSISLTVSAGLMKQYSSFALYGVVG